MQEFSVAFGRVTRATIVANPDLKHQVADLLNRAYFNLHATAFTSTDPQWANTITGAAMQLCLDPRVATLTIRELVHLFENIIRVSEEQLREARRHAAMASNVFYLKETALDAVLHEAPSLAGFTPASPKVVGHDVAPTGRVELRKPAESVA